MNTTIDTSLLNYAATMAQAMLCLSACGFLCLVLQALTSLGHIAFLILLWRKK
jgi:hypothetical protein